MENYISLVVALLVQTKNLTPKEGVTLNKKLRNTTIPGDYDQALLLIQTTLEDVKK